MQRPSAQENQPAPISGGIPPLVSLCGAFFFIFLGTGALQQFVLPILRDRAGMSDGLSTATFACVYLGGVAFLSVYGYVFHKLRERWCVVVGTLMYTLFPAALLLWPSPAVALAAAVLWGFGAELLWATGPTQVINASQRSRYGTTSGLFQSATYSGQMLGVILLGTLLSSYSDPARGQVALLVASFGLSLLGNLMALTIRVKPKVLPPARLSDALAALRPLAGRYLVALSVANYLGWGLLLTTLTLLISDIGAGDKLHWIVLPYYAGRLLVAWAAGHASDKVGRERVMLLGFLLGTSGLVVASLWPTVTVISVVSALLGMQSAMVSVASTAAVGDYIPQDQRHLVFAGTNAWGYLTAGVTMIGSQFLRQRYAGFVPSLLLFAGFYGACAILVTRMRAALRRDGTGVHPSTES